MDGSHGNYEFKIIEEIGGGTFGFVEKIELFNIAGNRCGYYARKSLKELGAELQEQFKRRFSREVTYQASCVHTNIVNVYLCNLKIEHPWFVMDLAEADLHKDLLSGLMSLEQKISALNMIFEGVIYMHGRDFLHRDLKPFNVLRFAGDIYKISDFGLVKNLDKERESELITKMMDDGMGTPYFMSPEARMGVYSHQSDIYALGLIMDLMQLPGSQALSKIFQKSTMHRPGDRYSSVTAMQSDFVKAASEIMS